MTGIVKSLLDLTNTLADNDVEIEVICLYRFPHFFKLPDSVKFHEPNFNYSEKEKIKYYFKILKFLREKISASRTDVVLSYHEYANYLVLLSSLGLGKRVFVSDRASPYRKVAFPAGWFRKWTYKKAAGIICQTQEAYEIQSKLFPRVPMKVLPNILYGVENLLTQRLDVPRKKRVVWAGRYEPLKGVEDIIKAFHQIDDKSWELHLIGKKSGDYFEKTKQLLDAINDERIQMMDSTTSIQEVLIDSEIFAFPSYSEGFPNALLEAMACGCACISYDCKTGPSEIITHDADGVLVEVGNKEKFQVDLGALMNSESTRLKYRTNSLSKVMKFSPSSLGPKYIEFLLN